jgi:hypothetical protein
MFFFRATIPEPPPNGKWASRLSPRKAEDPSALRVGGVRLVALGRHFHRLQAANRAAGRPLTGDREGCFGPFGRHFGKICAFLRISSLKKGGESA